MDWSIEWLTDAQVGIVWWKFRRRMFSLVENNYFETFIITMILLSSLALVRGGVVPGGVDGLGVVVALCLFWVLLWRCYCFFVFGGVFVDFLWF